MVTGSVTRSIGKRSFAEIRADVLKKAIDMLEYRFSPDNDMFEINPAIHSVRRERKYSSNSRNFWYKSSTCNAEFGIPRTCPIENMLRLKLIRANKKIDSTKPLDKI